jgi:TolB protein
LPSWRSATAAAKYDIYDMPADGGAEKQLPSNIHQDDGPDYSPDGKKMVYIGYPARTPTHNPRTVQIELKLVAINHGGVAASQKRLVKAIGGQGTMNVNSWAPDSMRFAYVVYEVLP